MGFVKLFLVKFFLWWRRGVVMMFVLICMIFVYEICISVVVWIGFWIFNMWSFICVSLMLCLFCMLIFFVIWVGRNVMVLLGLFLMWRICSFLLRFFWILLKRCWFCFFLELRIWFVIILVLRSLLRIWVGMVLRVLVLRIL